MSPPPAIASVTVSCCWWEMAAARPTLTAFRGRSPTCTPVGEPREWLSIPRWWREVYPNPDTRKRPEGLFPGRFPPYVQALVLIVTATRSEQLPGSVILSLSR